MSNILFPEIRGLAWNIVKTPTFSTEIQASLAGREVRIQNFQNPIWEYTLSYEYLQNDPKFRDENEQTPLEAIVESLDSMNVATLSTNSAGLDKMRLNNALAFAAFLLTRNNILNRSCKHVKMIVWSISPRMKHS